jgi:hypothetical protein
MEQKSKINKKIKKLKKISNLFINYFLLLFIYWYYYLLIIPFSEIYNYKLF